MFLEAEQLSAMLFTSWCHLFSWCFLLDWCFWWKMFWAEVFTPLKPFFSFSCVTTTGFNSVFLKFDALEQHKFVHCSKENDTWLSNDTKALQNHLLLHSHLQLLRCVSTRFWTSRNLRFMDAKGIVGLDFNWEKVWHVIVFWTGPSHYTCDCRFRVVVFLKEEQILFQPSNAILQHSFISAHLPIYPN